MKSLRKSHVTEARAMPHCRRCCRRHRCCFCWYAFEWVCWLSILFLYLILVDSYVAIWNDWIVYELLLNNINDIHTAAILTEYVYNNEREGGINLFCSHRHIQIGWKCTCMQLISIETRLNTFLLFSIQKSKSLHRFVCWRENRTIEKKKTTNIIKKPLPRFDS